MKEPIYFVAIAIFFAWAGSTATTYMIEQQKDAMECQISISNGVKTQHFYVGKLVGDRIP